MDEVMGNLFNTTSQDKKPLYKSLGFIVLTIVFIVVSAFISLSYGYTYYEKSRLSKYSQINVQQQLTQLLSAPDVAEYDWMRTLNPKAKVVEGGIVWSQDKQQGIMKFKNLPALSKKQQYHLWLYDRNKEQPISGHVFRQNSFDTNTRLVGFKPEKTVTSLYKFILDLENVNGTGEKQTLLRVQP